MSNIKQIIRVSWDDVKINLWERVDLKLPELIGEKVVYTDDVEKSEIHIIDWLWSIYCGNDTGRWILNNIINGGNIVTLSTYFKSFLDDERDLATAKRKIKRIILAIGLEVCGISSTGLIVGGSAISDENIDKLLYKIFYDYDFNLDFSTNPVELNYQGTKKIFIRYMIPKLYTVPSKYRFLDTTDTVSESGVYASVENVKSELDKIYTATKDEFKEQYEDLSDDFFENIIPTDNHWYYQTVLVDDA
jgi:hypothetical protein